MADSIEITILPDGSMKIVTEDFAASNHSQAERLVKDMLDAMGGEVVKTPNKDKIVKAVRRHEATH